MSSPTPDSLPIRPLSLSPLCRNEPQMLRGVRLSSGGPGLAGRVRVTELGTVRTERDSRSGCMVPHANPPSPLPTQVVPGRDSRGAAGGCVAPPSPLALIVPAAL